MSFPALQNIKTSQLKLTTFMCLIVSSNHTTIGEIQKDLHSPTKRPLMSKTLLLLSISNIVKVLYSRSTHSSTFSPIMNVLT